MVTLVQQGVYAGLPVRIAGILRNRGLTTHARVAHWYRADPYYVGAMRGIGPGSLAIIGTWLDAVDALDERKERAE